VPIERLVRDEFGLVKLRVVCLVAVDPIFHLTTELSNKNHVTNGTPSRIGVLKSLNGPCSSVSQRANGVAFDLVTQLLEHIYLGEVSITELDAL